MKRTLVLHREQLAEITSSELANVAGGASQPGGTCSCPDYTYYCITGYAICGDSRLVCS